MQPVPKRDDAGHMSPHRKFERHIVSGGPADTNTYILICPSTRDAVMIDAAGDADVILAAVRRSRARVRSILLTHGHPHHWSALGRLRDTLGAAVGIHLDDIDMLPLTPNFALTGEQLIAFGTAQLNVIHTPGHTGGSVCIHGDGHLFTGDTLLAADHDSAQAHATNPPLLLETLRDRVLALPATTLVCPGHGEPTTIAKARVAFAAWQAQLPPGEG
jgi:glyoxylase-like metal-dependent hydrolase (beta-lactamase superfamily II)